MVFPSQTYPETNDLRLQKIFLDTRNKDKRCLLVNGFLTEKKNDEKRTLTWQTSIHHTVLLVHWEIEGGSLAI